ncbi:MAG: DNA polymerase III subunit gamma/tau [Candidatus Omnitrophota bacterium]
MEYKAFALKYRPQSFDEVVGQKHVVSPLKSAILSKHVHHAYLFSGPRGVGKTSLARIFAKSLNCKDGPTVKPCGKCPSCTEINRGASLDIIEIDGASNRGIDDIRTLRENVKLSTAYSRFKIYIIDEVHQITTDGFNALLKTLEEPPKHVKFIFATTHPHKVIPTILSRCQKFQFHLLSLEDIVFKLKQIVKSEKLSIKDDLLYAIARSGAGSIRDAESLLDQLAPVALSEEKIEDIFSFLGIIDDDSLNEVARAIIRKNAKGCIELIDKLSRDGKDLSIFLSSFIERLRDVLLAKISKRAFDECANISDHSKKDVLALTGEIEIQDLLRAIELLIEAKERSRKLNSVRIPLELAVVKYIHTQELSNPGQGAINNFNASFNQDVQPLGAKGGGQPKQQNHSQPNCGHENEVIDGNIDNLDAQIDELDLDGKEIEPELIDDSQEEEAPDDGILLPELRAKWQAILKDMQRTRASISAHLFFAQPASTRKNVIIISFSKKDCFHKGIVEDAKNVKFIEEIMSKNMGKPVKVKFTLNDNIQKSEPECSEDQEDRVNEQEQPADDGSSHNDFMNDLLDTFGGNLHTDD